MLLNARAIALLSLLCNAVIAASPLPAGLSGVIDRRAVGPPSQDPFYVPPSGFDKLPTGSVLRSRRLPKLTQALGVAGAYQLLYNSKDDVGRTGATVTTVIIPKNADYTKHLAYHAPYDSANVDCSPSYPLAQGSVPGGLDAVAMGAALERGIPVSTPDYEGPDAAFTAGPQTARAVLDAIKAVVASKNVTGILPTAKTVMFGYSGGSIAVEWAAEYQATYAPKVKIVAAALGGLPVNLHTALNAIAVSRGPGLAFASLNGLAASYPDFATWLSNGLVPAKAQDFYRAKTSCDLGIYNDKNLYSYFKNGSASFKEAGFLNTIAKAGIMGRHGTPKSFPLLVYKGTADEIVPTIGQTDALVKKYCADGATVKYFRYINGTHGSTADLSPQALQFLFNVINGTAVPKGCTTQNVQP